MTVSISEICDPRRYLVDEANEQARLAAHERPRFDFELSRFVQLRCMSNDVSLPTVFRGLEVLGGLLDEDRLSALIRHYLRSSDPQIASKSVLILGRRSHSLGWLKSVSGESDARVRANVVESMWTRREPEANEVLEAALRDSHHRVCANGVHGLYLLNSESYLGGLNRLLSSEDPEFRRAGIWVLRSGGKVDVTRLKSLIRDTNPAVKHAVFAALVALREEGAGESRKAAAGLSFNLSQPPPSG